MGSVLTKRLADTLLNSRDGSLWNPVGFGLVLSLLMILVAVPWPSPIPLTGSGFGSHAQLVDILAQRKEVRQFSCCRTAGSLEVSYRK